MQSLKLYFLICMTVLLYACGGQESTPPASAPAETPAPIPPPAEPEAEEVPAPPAPASPAPPEGKTTMGEPLYPWVSTLNVRDKPSTSGTIVATVQPKDALLPTGERSPKTTTLSLRGTTFNEPWVEVGTPDGKQGWVFGGALQTSNQRNSTLLGEPNNSLSGKCPKVGGPDDPMEGCGCELKKLYGNDAWINIGFSGAACVNLNGQTYQMDGYFDSYSNLDTKRPWIILGDKAHKLFGGPSDFDYEKVVIRLTDALLHFEQLPREIPIENNMTAGMFVREVRDMATDAIAAAKKRRQAGERSGDARWVYSNDSYRVVVTANEYKEPMQDTGISYEGILQVEDAKGKLLTQVPVKGSCGC